MKAMKVLALGALTVVALNGAIAGTGFSGAAGGAKKYSLNNSVGKNQILFQSDAPMEKINGTADQVTGNFQFDPSNLEATKGRIEVSVKSMTTAIAKRDEHMYSDVWLDAGKYPSITFDIESLKDIKVETKDGRNVATATAVGKFTCHGITKPLTTTINLTYLPESDATKKRAAGNFVMVKTTFPVSLKDHNITGKTGVVGKSVGETISIEANLFANS